MQGALAGSSKLYCAFTCYSYEVIAGQVNFQGPIGNVRAIPTVGERFYVQVNTTAFSSPFVVSGNFRMELLLPEGVKTDIRSNTDVRCAITDTSFNYTRDMFGAECQDPVKAGLYEQFPSVVLGEGEVASYFVPVVADRVFTKNAAIGLLISHTTNVSGLINPLYATNDLLVVNPATVAPPSATAKVTPKVKKRKITVTWSTVPGATSYQVRVSKKGKKGSWRTVSNPKFVTGKLKKGKYTVEVRAVGPGGTGPVKKSAVRVK